MPGPDAFKVEGLVVESLSNRTYRVELANGHQLLGFVAGRAKAGFAGLRPGVRVKLALSPYDLSQGRILVDRQ